MADRSSSYQTWTKDQDLILTSIEELGFFDWDDFDTECFGDTQDVVIDGTPAPYTDFEILAAGATITPPIAANYADKTQELVVSPTINSSRLWNRDYPELKVTMKSSTTSTSYANGYLDVQFFPQIKGYYTSVLWVFGDGHTSTLHEPSHRFEQFDGGEGNGMNVAKEFNVGIRVEGPTGMVEATGLKINLPGKE